MCWEKVHGSERRNGGTICAHLFVETFGIACERRSKFTLCIEEMESAPDFELHWPSWAGCWAKCPWLGMQYFQIHPVTGAMSNNTKHKGGGFFKPFVFQRPRIGRASHRIYDRFLVFFLDWPGASSWESAALHNLGGLDRSGNFL